MQMKTVKIIQLVVFLAAIVILIVILFLFLLGKMNFSNFFRTEKQIELLSQTEKLEGITEISLDLSSADIIITPSDSDEIAIVYSGPASLKEDVDLTVEVNDGILSIVQDKIQMRNFFFWNWTSRIIEISLPESYAEQLTIANTSGDLQISGAYELLDFSTVLTSGSVGIADMTSTDFSLKSTSGDITLGRIEADTFDITVSSGEIIMKEITGDGIVRTTSGDIEVQVIKGEADLSTSSGDIHISSLTGGGRVQCTSGNIDISVAEALGDLTVDTTSGEVEISLDEGVSYSVDASCVSGDISSNVPMNYSGSDKDNASADIGESPQYHLVLETTSGDIQLAA